MNNSKEQKIYSGNFILSVEGIILVAFFIFSCFKTFKYIESGNSGYWGYFLTWLLLFILFTYEMNYFILNTKKLVVRNPIWFWRNIEFDLDAIEEISIVLPFKTSISLHIKTENSTKIIEASSLSNKTWKELKRNLEENNITVIDKVWG